MRCRFCKTNLEHLFADLGTAPPANAFLGDDHLQEVEHYYPLRAFVCDHCFLVQIDEFESPADLFSNYVYFSSYSRTWVEHARSFARSAIEQFSLGPDHQVVEVASNDGYLLQFFLGAGIPAFGVEPAANIARIAEEKGIPTLCEFFGADTARILSADGKMADLLVANNVLAHVPDINDFVVGLKILLKPRGVITLEFPHLLQLILHNQFDTIYHEHFSYISVLAAQKIFEKHNLRIFDVEELPTHGGSLRLSVCHGDNDFFEESDGMSRVKELECAHGLDRLESYSVFQKQIHRTKRALLTLLIEAKERSQSIAGYGASAKGNTLLNFCGIGRDFLDYVADLNDHKQGMFLPGTHIPVVSPDMIFESRPDYVLILPWNLEAEIMSQLEAIREWGGRFVIPIPTPRLR